MSLRGSGTLVGTVLDVERTVHVGIAVLLLVGCNTPPSQVGGSGSSETLPNPSSSTTEDPEPTTEASATAASQDGSGTTSGSTDEPATTLPLDDSGTTTLDPSTTSGSSGDPTTGTESSTGEPGDCHPLLAEVLYDPPGGNGGKQWIRLYNPCSMDLDLTGYSLGWGGNDYAGNGADLTGTIVAGDCFLLGGDMSNADNFNPIYDLELDFNGDLQSSGNDADGVALFADLEENITVATVPVDAVIYGVSNTNELLDAEGDTPAPHVGDAPQGQSIRRTALASTWIIERSPMPNECPPL